MKTINEVMPIQIEDAYHALDGKIFLDVPCLHATSPVIESISNLVAALETEGFDAAKTEGKLWDVIEKIYRKKAVKSAMKKIVF